MGSMINHNTINELKNIKRTTSYNYDDDDYYAIRRRKESNDSACLNTLATVAIISSISDSSSYDSSSSSYDSSSSSYDSSSSSLSE